METLGQKIVFWLIARLICRSAQRRDVSVVSCPGTPDVTVTGGPPIEIVPVWVGVSLSVSVMLPVASPARTKVVYVPVWVSVVASIKPVAPQTAVDANCDPSGL